MSDPVASGPVMDERDVAGEDARGALQVNLTLLNRNRIVVHRRQWETLRSMNRLWKDALMKA